MYFILLLLLIYSCPAICQSIRFEGIPCYYVKSEYGIPYKSNFVLCNSTEVINFRFPDECDNKRFYLNGLPLLEKDFSLLKIRKKEVDLEQCIFAFEHSNDSIVCIKYYTVLTIPICVNGVEYKNGEIIPFNYIENEIIKVEKEKRLLKKNRIIIQIE